MLAVRKLVPGPGEPALVEVPIPEPGPGQVRVAVTATGICGTDIHLMRDEYRFYPPVTMGHEVAGRVDAVAPDVDPGWVGALVALETVFSSCGACRWCRGGRPMLCAARLSIGSGVDGGFAPYVVVPARNLHRIPASVDDHAAALAEPLACVCNAMGEGVVGPGDRVVVTGAGAMGVLAAQVAKAAGGRVIVVGTAADAERLQLIATLGMETSSTGDPDDVARLAALGEGRAIDVVVECAGVGAAGQQRAPARAAQRDVRPDRSPRRRRIDPVRRRRAQGDPGSGDLRERAGFVAAGGTPSGERARGPRAARVRGAAARGVAARLRQCRGPGRDQDRPRSPTWRRSGGSLIGGSTAG